jgi:predicted transcriptional regulator
MLNSMRFIKAFNSIEQYLRKQTQNDKRLHYYDLVNIATKSNAIVRRYERDLKEYADLRNAIIHESSDGHVIAEPNELAVNDIEHINSILHKPPSIIPLFQSEVSSFSVNDSIGAAVKLMLYQSFSQVPVFNEERFVGLLTTDTISRWLGSCVADDIFILSETKINHVLRYTEDRKNHIFLKKGSTIFDALETFQEFENRGKSLKAILITESGKSTQKIIGIMTISDLPKALKSIGRG